MSPEVLNKAKKIDPVQVFCSKFSRLLLLDIVCVVKKACVKHFVLLSIRYFAAYLAKSSFVLIKYKIFCNFLV